MTVKELIEMLETCNKELIDKLQQFDEDKLVLVEDTEYKEFQAIDIELVDDGFVIITTTIK